MKFGIQGQVTDIITYFNQSIGSGATHF